MMLVPKFIQEGGRSVASAIDGIITSKQPEGIREFQARLVYCAATATLGAINLACHVAAAIGTSPMVVVAMVYDSPTVNLWADACVKHIAALESGVQIAFSEPIRSFSRPLDELPVSLKNLFSPPSLSTKMWQSVTRFTSKYPKTSVAIVALCVLAPLYWVERQKYIPFKKGSFNGLEECPRLKREPYDKLLNACKSNLAGRSFAFDEIDPELPKKIYGGGKKEWRGLAGGVHPDKNPEPTCANIAVLGQCIRFAREHSGKQPDYTEIEFWKKLAWTLVPGFMRDHWEGPPTFMLTKQ